MRKMSKKIIILCLWRSWSEAGRRERETERIENKFKLINYISII